METIRWKLSDFYFLLQNLEEIYPDLRDIIRLHESH